MYRLHFGVESRGATSFEDGDTMKLENGSLATPLESDSVATVRAGRADFPILSTLINGNPLAYLDNAATTHKPQSVINRIQKFYAAENSNIHRGVHTLTAQATDIYEEARSALAQFVNGFSVDEIIFNRGCTEGINCVADAFASPAELWQHPSGLISPLSEGDVILVSEMEHHSNLVPWQIAAAKSGAVVKAIPITDSGDLDLDEYQALLKMNPVRIVAVTHASNVIGTVNPIQLLAELAHQHSAIVVVDGAQAVAHLAIDVQNLGADFYAFSGHKMFGPTGIGVLWGKQTHLEAMPPYQTGGGMVREVTMQKTTFAQVPAKFEAGTPNIAGAIGLAEAARYLAALANGGSGPASIDKMRPQLQSSFAALTLVEDQLLAHALQALTPVKGLKVLGRPHHQLPVISFVLDGVHPHDLGTILDSEGVAVRVGHHCCMPLMRRLGVPATTRASLAFYNTDAEIERLIDAINKARSFFGEP